MHENVDGVLILIREKVRATRLVDIRKKPTGVCHPAKHVSKLFDRFGRCTKTTILLVGTTNLIVCTLECHATP